MLRMCPLFDLHTVWEQDWIKSMEEGALLHILRKNQQRQRRAFGLWRIFVGCSIRRRCLGCLKAKGKARKLSHLADKVLKNILMRLHIWLLERKKWRIRSFFFPSVAAMFGFRFVSSHSIYFCVTIYIYISYIFF